MGSSIFEKIFGRCAHQFSWPRKSSEGGYYQVCLSCGAQYGYDWEAMKRTGRIEARPARFDPSKPEKRLPLVAKAFYREVGSDTWHEATTANMSQTGVKLHGKTVLKENTPIEVVFEMPEEIAGQPGSKVACSGRVVRVVESSDKEPAPAFAATLRDYHYIRPAVETADAVSR